MEQYTTHPTHTQHHVNSFRQVSFQGKINIVKRAEKEKIFRFHTGEGTGIHFELEHLPVLKFFFGAVAQLRNKIARAVFTKINHTSWFFT